MTFNQRKELNEISKRVFGTANRWRKLVTKGKISDKKVVWLTEETVKIYMLELESQAQAKLEEIRKQAELDDNKQIGSTGRSDQTEHQETEQADSSERELPGAE